MGLPAPIQISEQAAAHLQASFDAADQEYAGLLISLTENKGCAGAEYKFKPITADEVDETYEVVQDKGLTLYIPRDQILFIFGSELILEQDDFNTRLDFKNPNETTRCGCGESIGFQNFDPPKPR